jgi:hypothetical protein
MSAEVAKGLLVLEALEVLGFLERVGAELYRLRFLVLVFRRLQSDFQYLFR